VVHACVDLPLVGGRSQRSFKWTTSTTLLGEAIKLLGNAQEERCFLFADELEGLAAAFQRLGMKVKAAH